jgi:hypothetical protein
VIPGLQLPLVLIKMLVVALIPSLPSHVTFLPSVAQFICCHLPSKATRLQVPQVKKLMPHSLSPPMQPFPCHFCCSKGPHWMLATV